jgi:CrcB protein
VPVVIVDINVVGAFLLGLLLAALTRRGPDEGARLRVRLLLGTGVLGGFTTYSALATDTTVLLTGGAVGPALLYALGTVLIGALASWIGIRAADVLPGRAAS